MIIVTMIMLVVFSPEYWLYPPIEALQRILQSVNSDFVPSGGEKRIPTTETAARMKDKQFVRRYEKLMPDLTPLEGQKTRSDVVNRHTKEIILPAGRKITRAILVRLCDDIRNLELLDENDNPVIPALKLAQVKAWNLGKEKR